MFNSTPSPLGGFIAATIAFTLSASGALAGPLLDRIEAGEPIRIGFANESPFAYPGENGEPLGFVNAYTLGLLAEMGYDNIEVVVTDWGGLIPALNAGRVDIVTGGMNIMASRCAAMNFSEPMLMAGDAFVVPTGNPMDLNNYEDLINKDARFVTGIGYNQVEIAKHAGVPEAKITQVPGPTEILAAIRAGRADAGGVAYFTAVDMDRNNDDIEISDVSQLPETSMQWAAIGFRKNDQDFLDAFNAAQESWLGSEPMMEAVAEYGYGPDNIPTGQTTAWVCENR